MNAQTRDWLEGLREFAAAHRGRTPLADLSQPTAAQAAERSILGADLSTRLAGIGSLLEARAAREARAENGGALDVDPALVITTSAAGIAAVADLVAAPQTGLAPLAARIAAVTELEYRLWCIRQPDEEYRLHVNLWNWVKTSVPKQRWPEFARHPLGAGESYWLHRAGVAGAGAADCRHCHLWKWNGRHAALLQPFVAEQTVGPLADVGAAGRGGEPGRD